jgi:hypothetical protein
MERGGGVVLDVCAYAKVEKLNARASMKPIEIVRVILFIGYNTFLLKMTHGKNKQYESQHAEKN